MGIPLVARARATPSVGWSGAPADPLVQQLHCLTRQIVCRVPDHGQKRVEQGGELDLAETDERPVFWHTPPSPPHLDHGSHRDEVVGRHDGIRKPFLATLPIKQSTAHQQIEPGGLMCASKNPGRTVAWAQWKRTEIEWTVSHEGGALAGVTTGLLDSETVLESQTSQGGGSLASGEHGLRTRGGGRTFTVRQTVRDALGHEASDTITVNF